MKVLHAIEALDPRSGGTSTAFLSLLSALVRCGELEVAAIAPSHPDATFEPHLEGVIHRSGPGGQLRGGDLFRAAEGFLRERRPEVVHLHGLWSQDLVRLAALARSLGSATLWQPHGMLVRRAIGQKALKKQVFLRLGLRRELAEAASIIFCTEGERELSVRPGRAEGARSDVVPLPVEAPWGEGELPAARRRAREALGLDADADVALFMGRLHPVKRVDLTLRAFAAASERRPGAQLLVAGSGEAGHEAQLRELAGELGVAERVRWLGWVAAEDRWDVLAAADALVLNSMFENFGFVLLEALAVGTGVVLSENLAIAAEVAEAGVGEVRPAEAGALGEGLAAALEKKGGPPSGPAWVRGRYSPASVARGLLACYEGVAPAQSAAAANWRSTSAMSSPQS